METIVTPVTVVTIDSTRIIHNAKADFVARHFPPVVRLVQYDKSLPVIAVELLVNGQPYTLPTGAGCNIRVHKPDATYVYNGAIGCDSTRTIVYFEVTQNMAAANGEGLAIVELVVNGDIAGTSLINLHFEENPVPEDAIESSDDWETIYELGQRIIASTVTPVSNAADMTDTDRVYLYTGTETGWNQGHMYYYNGSTWVDAGIAVTDKTLSVSDMAADAKTVGDRLTTLDSDVANLKASDTTQNADISALKEDFKEVTILERFRDSQQINKGIDGVTFLLVTRTGNNTICNNKLVYAEHDAVLNVKTGYMYIVATFSSGEWTTANHIANTPWKYGEYKIPKGTWFTVQIMKTDRTAFPNGEDDKVVVTISDLAYEEELTAIKETLDEYGDDITSITNRVSDLEEKPTLYHILVTGQSLAVGAEGNPALTTATPYEFIGKAYQFNGGSRAIDGMENDTGVEEIAILDKCLEDFGSLCEETHILTLGEGQDQRHAYQGETISSALGYWFARNTGKKVLVSNHGFGGFSYNQLKKGTIAYNNSIRAVHHAKELCDRLGWNYKVYAVAVVHGEHDSTISGMTADTYKGYLKTWQNDYDADIKAITGQEETVQLFASQTASAAVYNLSESPVPNGVFLASIEDSDIHYVCPQYCSPLTYAGQSDVHMNNLGYRALGEFFGYQMARKFNGSANNTLYPIKTELSGTTLTITFNPFSQIVFDTNNVAGVSDGHYGFELVNDTNNASITNVEISGTNKVVITLSTAPSSGAYISYAYKALADEMGYVGSQLGVRGNLRNTTSFNSMFIVRNMAQWCAIFSVPVNWTA